ncbi:MAG: nucleotidyltransferase family protein [Cyclobacteriaceae bacterium]
MANNASTGVIILAAGSSSRLGRPKQLLTFRNKPLLQHVIDTAGPFPFATRVLVLGAHAGDISGKIATKTFTPVMNPGWATGMGTSISKGLKQALLQVPELQHVLILLSDQPFLSKDLIQKLIRTHLAGDKPVTASEYNGVTGVPAAFSEELFADLLNLDGDRGANALIAGHPANVVPFDKGDIDIDTMEDYRKLTRPPDSHN